MKKKITFSLFVLAGIATLMIATVLNYKFSEGVRSGRLVKITHKGTVLKTIEGTLHLGSGDNLSWNFSVHDKKLAAELEQAIGKSITMDYVERFYRLWWDTPYDIQGYRVDENDAQWFGHFCKLVQLLRQDQTIVERVREILSTGDPSLLEHIRRCQQQAPGQSL